MLMTLLVLAGFGQVAVAQNKVHDVEITVNLNTDGSAQVREVWDMTLSRGTEVYLGRENLGDIKIRDLTVSDETGTTYKTDRSWDTDRSFDGKKNHCGLNSISDGYEICWGIGEYGHRTVFLAGSAGGPVHQEESARAAGRYDALQHGADAVCGRERRYACPTAGRGSGESRCVDVRDAGPADGGAAARPRFRLAHCQACQVECHRRGA